MTLSKSIKKNQKTESVSLTTSSLKNEPNSDKNRKITIIKLQTTNKLQETLLFSPFVSLLSFYLSRIYRSSQKMKIMFHVFEHSVFYL